MLTVHALISLFSVAFATYMIVKPSRMKITATYSLLTATFLSGTYLVLGTGTHILKACVMGLAYFAVIALAIHVAEARLAHKVRQQV
jgi:hypothetical protein